MYAINLYLIEVHPALVLFILKVCKWSDMSWNPWC